MYVSAIMLPASIYGPSMDQWVGVSSLSLCGPNGWKDRMEVCLPLQAVVNTTSFPDSQNKQIQGDYCSFARAVIERKLSYPCPFYMQTTQW